MSDPMTIADVFDEHDLDRASFASHMGWSRVSAHHKLKGARGWSPDEIELAATWLRAHGVPVQDRDVAALVRAASAAGRETSHG